MTATMKKKALARKATSTKQSKQPRRLTVPPDILRALTVIPGVGPSLAADLYGLGIQSVAALKKRDPEVLYEELMKQVGGHVDRCVLYVFRCAVYFAEEARPNPEKLKWWNWKD
jgi:predicted flap endonuclease-1-like 5' DNA nuclease